MLWLVAIFLLTVAFAWWQFQSQIGRAMRADTQATCMAVYNALDQFRTEYDHLPAPRSAAVKGQDWHTDSSAAENLIHILKGRDGWSGNLKAIDFLGDMKDAKQQDGEYLNGLLRTEKTTALLDPWGHPYLIRLDGDRDGYVTDPEHPENRLHTVALVWSAGKDGDPERWSDNVGSWISAQ